MVTINEQAENDYLFAQFATLVPTSTEGLWIGLNDAGAEGTRRVCGAEVVS